MSEPLRIALAGNPNSGKSTLFNALTGLRQRVGNFPGVTVERKSGRARGLHGEAFEIVDLPGAYSLDARSPDEAITRDVLLGRAPGERRPDLVVNVLDATNLGRHLFLTSQLLDAGLPTVVALNMVDAAERRGLRLDPAALARELGVPVVPTAASSGHGLIELRAALARPAAPRSPATPRDRAERFAWIREIHARSVRGGGDGALRWTDRIDAVLTHRVWGGLFLVLIMTLLFYALFALAAGPMDAIDQLIAFGQDSLRNRLPAGDLRSLLVDGALPGVGGVLIFLPQILILFFFIGLLEDSGYLARAAFLADWALARFGLQGRSLIPLLSSFACAVPGVMATRTIENRQDRLATMFVAPLMSCPARLPVYTLAIAMLLPDDFGGAWAKAGLLLLMYAVGLAVALGLAWIGRGTVLRDRSGLFLLELPPYRCPAPRDLLLRMIERSRIFLSQAGTIILALSIVVWALVTYPKPAQAEATPAEALAHSAAGRIGHAIEPLIAPMGFDWKIGIGLIASFAAREAFVGTMAIVYGAGDEEAAARSVGERLRAGTTAEGRPVFTPAVAASLMIFYALAMQCLSTVAVVRRESGSWRWPALQFVVLTGLAYAASVLAYQLVRLLGWG